ncbi:penicillin-insensitive murein endopeptidase [Anaeromyxobacter sp. PSR-1]|uniref:penicillin-insensitive murein endopeptidase n=1 Tax=Anaeromyxobacter sp. PSR-1 TaxID=1300915 RepID=UPI0005E0B267|nr:penicillin-insensitive murein endopeptidase [Anaeromyxobacter sp. PSR-1]GAO01208.1 penicillin-insensitive murein endopeptidase [Anaeromyxobacter sp. PSR-1]
MKRLAISAVVLAVTAFPAALAWAWLRVLADGDTPSRAIGTIARGSVEHAHVIPPWGPGYVTYSFLGSALGRQYVHGRVRDVLLATFATRSRSEGGRTFVVGETGWPRGGRFRPHRSHQNGMAVDVFVPLRTRAGAAASLGAWPWNAFGYGLEFDARGERGDQRIDFESLAALLLEAEDQSARRGLRIARVILAPEYVPLVLDTPSGRRLGALGSRITRRPVWVRHDEHVHLEFEEAGAAPGAGR